MIHEQSPHRKKLLYGCLWYPFIVWIQSCDLIFALQDYSAEKFEESPIIFGDYLKMGASQSDRIYEELVDMKKVASVLSEVSLSI